MTHYFIIYAYFIIFFTLFCHIPQVSRISLCVFRVFRGSSCHSFGCRSLTSQPWGVVAAVRYPRGLRTSQNKNTLDYEI